MSVTSWHRCAVSILALGAALAATPPASAQNAPPEGAQTFLGRIILAAGRARVAIETPQAVTAVEAEEIEREQAATPNELLRQIPGATGFGGAGLTGQFFNIRGIGTNTASDENRIIVTVDGVQKYSEQYRIGSFFGDPELYRRVEVLRGPGASLLYGSGALAGVIAFETREAADFLEGDAQTALRLRVGGNTSGGGTNGSVILAHRFNERLEALGAFSIRREGAYRPGGGGAAIPDSRLSARSALLGATWRMADDSDARLRFSWTRWDSDGQRVPYSTDLNLPVFGLIDRRVQDDTAQITFENPAADTPWLDTRVQLTFSDTQIDQRNATAQNPSPFFFDSIYRYRTYGLNARNTISMQGAGWDNYLTFGLQAARQDRRHVAGGMPRASHPEGESDRFGLYLQNEFVAGGFSAIAALRHDRATLRPTAGVPAGFGDAQRRTGTAASLALRYQLTADFAVFASAARTVRLPTLDEVFDSGFGGGTVSLGLRPEIARSIEAGFSWQHQGVLSGEDSLELKLTAFDNDIRDRIERPVIPGAPSFQNVSRARIRGIELEAAYEAPAWFGRLAVSHIRGVNSTTGDRLASTPAPEAVVEFGHRWADLGVEAGWRGTFVGGATLAAAQPERFSGYATHDLFVTWRPQNGVLRGAEVQLAATNIFDRSYRNILDGPAANSFPGRGRDLRLSVGRRFTW
ncbi:MAG: TonB-dependent receptor domain-containing protein [Pararhodobacter sp.]